MSEIGLWEDILKKPSYGFSREGKLYAPTKSELWSEFFSNINIFNDRHNWLPFWSWLIFAFCMSFFIAYLAFFFEAQYWWVMVVWPMVVLNIHGTCWLHRYSSHRTYSFSNLAWAHIFKNLVPKIVIEEAYVVSHYVHHRIPDVSGDPYNPKCGWLYSFLADANHQKINPNLDEKKYSKVCELLKHTGCYLNSYEQYKKWGSVSHPLYAIFETLLSWVITYVGLSLLLNQSFALAALAGVSTWAFTIRTFNFKSHGGGKDKRVAGKDPDESSLALNQYLPGTVAGEWHANHHVYPSSARNGFRTFELDLSFLLIKFLNLVGIIKHYNDAKEEFVKNFGENEKWSEHKVVHYLLWIGLACVAFAAVYGYCNWAASQNSNLYKVYFDWELQIPFLPWMIIPYRSLDLLMVVVLFFLSKENLRRFALHMMVCLIPVGLIFYFFPGQAGFVRPDPDTLGIWAPIYKIVYALDKPHNLFPSLHVAYSYFGLMAIADQHGTRFAKLSCFIWFALICASIIFTYQHHLFDLASGLLVGWGIYRYTFIPKAGVT